MSKTTSIDQRDYRPTSPLPPYAQHSSVLSKINDVLDDILLLQERQASFGRPNIALLPWEHLA
jgi:hypothetical protein